MYSPSSGECAEVCYTAVERSNDCVGTWNPGRNLFSYVLLPYVSLVPHLTTIQHRRHFKGHSNMLCRYSMGCVDPNHNTLRLVIT